MNDVLISIKHHFNRTVSRQKLKLGALWERSHPLEAAAHYAQVRAELDADGEKMILLGKRFERKHEEEILAYNASSYGQERAAHANCVGTRPLSNKDKV